MDKYKENRNKINMYKNKKSPEISKKNTGSKNKPKKIDDTPAKSKEAIFCKGKTDYLFIGILSIIIILGLITLLSASSSKALSNTGDPYALLKKQFKYMMVGILACVFVSRINYKKFNRLTWSRFCYIISIFLIIIVRIKGTSEGGAQRWLGVGSFSFQPSEMIKLLVIGFNSIRFSNLHTFKTKEERKKEIWKIVAVDGLIFSLIFVLQSHLSAFVVLAGVTISQAMIVGLPVKLVVGLIMFGVAVLVTLSKIANPNSPSYRLRRISNWVDPFQDREDKGWQIIQSLYAIGSGGLLGVGIGQSKQQYFLPELENDFIGAIYAEETGFIGILCLIVLFTILLARGFIIAKNAKDIFGKVLATGIVSLFAIELIINLMVITKIIPVTGMALPFFSYGGTAMIINLVAVGILLSIARVSNERN